MITQTIFNGLVTGSYYILIAIGLSTIYGVLGISHFAHGSVAVFGGYVTYYITNLVGLPLLVGVLISIVVSALLGVVIERLGYKQIRKRKSLENIFIVALGAGMLIDNVIELLFGPDQVVIKNNFNRTFKIGNLKVAELRLYIILVTILLIILLTLYMKKTKFGKAIRAVSQNSEASIMMGVNTELVIAVVFAVSSAYGAIAGSFMGTLFAIYPTMGGFTVMKGFAVLIIGGLGSTSGTVVGGIIIGLVESFGAHYISSDFKEMYAFIIMIAVLMFKPEGLFAEKVRG